MCEKNYDECIVINFAALEIKSIEAEEKLLFGGEREI
jgi:hypothetical protein